MFVKSEDASRPVYLPQVADDEGPLQVRLPIATTTAFARGWPVICHSVLT